MPSKKLDEIKSLRQITEAARWLEYSGLRGSWEDVHALFYCSQQLPQLNELFSGDTGLRRAHLLKYMPADESSRMDTDSPRPSSRPSALTRARVRAMRRSRRRRSSSSSARAAVAQFDGGVAERRGAQEVGEEGGGAARPRGRLAVCRRAVGREEQHARDAPRAV